MLQRNANKHYATALFINTNVNITVEAKHHSGYLVECENLSTLNMSVNWQ